jgi:hypothetical protein
MFSKFVGFELDAKLSWKSHIEAKCRAAQRQIHLIRGCLRRTWGLDTNKLLILYKSIINCSKTFIWMLCVVSNAYAQNL